MGRYDPIRTYATDNRFSFTCPIFGATTEIRTCLKLRDLLWAGQKQEVRRGCQACLHDSKCPIVPIVREVQARGEDPGYYAAEPRHGALKAHHLERIQNVVVMDQTLNAFGVPEHERNAILAANGFNARLHSKTETPPPRARKTVVVTDAGVEAATTGDLGAAITEAVRGAA